MPPSAPGEEAARTGRQGRPRRRAATALAGLALALALAPQGAMAQKVRITNLSDVDFGLIANPQLEARRSQNICVFSNSSGEAYSVSASGSGAGSSFALASGSDSLAYEVEWSQTSGQTSGIPLAPAVALTGQQSAATQQFCNSGPATSASMTIVLRAAELSRARQGNYSGTLTLLIAAE